MEPDEILRQESYDVEWLAEAIVDRHYARLHYVAYSILGDPDEADDAVQEAVIRALARINGYTPGSNMKGWLTAILVNQCRNMIRRRKTRQRLSTNLQRLFGRKPPQPSPEDRRTTEEAKERLWSAVNQLNEKHRLPIILRYVHNFSVREIADILDVREGTIHSRLHYACRRLRRQLAVSEGQDLIEAFLHE